MLQTEYSHAISGLKSKRAELADEIDDLKDEIKRKGDQMGTLDAAIVVFEPGFDTSSIPHKRPRKTVKIFKKGQLGGVISDVLREASGAVPTAEIVQQVMRLTDQVEANRARVARETLAHLRSMVKQGRVVKVGERMNATWALKRLHS